MYKTVRRLARDNEPIVVAIELWKRAGIHLKSAAYFLIYGLVHSRLGGSVRICGSRYIEVGRSLCCRGDIWIEANKEEPGGTNRKVIVIGSGVNASDSLHITGISSIYIGDECLIGSFVLISDHTHGIYVNSRDAEDLEAHKAPRDRKLHSKGRVHIGARCWIGDGCKILAGSHICEGSVVAANSVVNRAFEKPCMIGGIPARVIAEFDSETMRWIRCAR